MLLIDSTSVHYCVCACVHDAGKTIMVEAAPAHPIEEIKELIEAKEGTVPLSLDHAVSKLFASAGSQTNSHLS